MMEHANDIELLRNYVEHGSDAAFAALVKRHLDLVYSAALRQVREADGAPSTSETTWEDIEPLLDDAVGKLGEPDRAAILLRFFENKSLREVGAALGVSDDTAQKRISRALERLKKSFAKDGVALSVDVLALMLPAQAVQSAPGSLANFVVNCAASQAAISVSTATIVKGTLQMIAWTKVKFAAGFVALLVFGAGTATIVAQKVVRNEGVTANEEQRSTPLGALRYLADAFAAFDGEKIKDSFVTNSPASQRVIGAMASAVSAEGHLRKAMEERFGKNGDLGRRALFRMSFGQDRLDEAEERIVGTNATVTIPNAKTKRLVQVGKVWKIDDSGGEADQNAESKTGMFDTMAGVADGLAQDVKAGRYQNASEVRAALQKNVLAAMKQ